MALNSRVNQLVNKQFLLLASLVGWLFVMSFWILPPASAEPLSSTTLNLSSSVKATTNVHYIINFVVESNDTNSFVIDLCSNSALLVETCNAPVGLNVAAAQSSGSDIVSVLTNHTIQVDLSATASQGQTVRVELEGITNPDEAAALYVRLATYQTAQDASDYISGDPGQFLDQGAVIVTIADGVSFTGDVPETLEFCVSGIAFDSDGCQGQLTHPSVSLGTDGTLGTALSTATIFSRLSTNALGGAAVNLKSNAVGCGGLIRSGAPGACDIKPQTTPGPITDGAGMIGLKLGAIKPSSGITPQGGYSTSDYYLHYETGDAVGVTSVLGDAIYGSNQPIPGGIVPIIFGANRALTTPAGDYFSNFSLVATGTF